MTSYTHDGVALSKQLCLQPSKRAGIGAIVYMLAPLCRVTRKAKGLNIINVATAAPNNWSDMIGRELDPRSVTGKALVSVMITKLLPFGRCVTTPRLSFAGSALVLFGVNFVGVSLPIAAGGFGNLVRVGFLPFTTGFCRSVSIGIIPTEAFPGYLFWIFSFPATLVLGCPFGIIPCPLADTLLAGLICIPFACTASLARLAVPSCHNKKSPLPECLTRGLRGTILSGRLTRPHVLKLLAQLSGLLFFSFLIIPFTRGNYYKRIAQPYLPGLVQPAKPRQDVLL